ncbi:hypothetical protein JCM33374_g413 [Metschnikowia sp. JCM 33374]|nr:hypothetical protein JCM33374_g413 [Metschnikowia sp. JCM 33374]
MFEPDRSEDLSTPDIAPRRQSLPYRTIWSTDSPTAQRQFSLDATCGAPGDSPSRPPATPLPQLCNFQETSAFKSRSAACEGSSNGFPGPFKDPYPAGLGLVDYNSVSYGHGANGPPHGFHGSFANQNQFFNQRQNFNWQDDPQEGLFSASLSSPNMYSQSQMTYPSTPSFPSQNASPRFQQATQNSPFLKYDISGQCRVSPSTAQSFFHERPEYSFNQVRASSAYSASPVYQNSGVAEQEQYELSPIETVPRNSTLLNTPSQNIGIYNPPQVSANQIQTTHAQARQKQIPQAQTIQAQTLQAQTLQIQAPPIQNSPTPTLHARRHSFGDSFRLRGTEMGLSGRTESSDSTRLSVKVHQYFTRDPHERVKIDYEVILGHLEKEGDFLAPEYKLPDFNLDERQKACTLVFVAFKAGRLDAFYIPQDSPQLGFLKVGDLVIVEADRGEDLGRISRMNISLAEARVLKLLEYLEQHSAFSERSAKDLQLRSLLPNYGGGTHGYFSTLTSPKPVVSLANQSQIGLLMTKRQDEERACRISLETISEPCKIKRRTDEADDLPVLDLDELKQMEIVDAEYQFDRKKLTFYYSAQRRLDFRSLVRELFRIYKTRIWMCAVVGIPYKLTKTPGDRRHSQPNRNEGMRGRGGFNRERNQGRFSAPQQQQHQQQQQQQPFSGSSSRQCQGQMQPLQSPEVANVRPMFSRKNTQEYVSNTAAGNGRPGGMTSESRAKVKPSVVPRNLRDDTSERTADGSEPEEKCVGQSLVDTLNS